jgi:hypothetical protein
MEKFGSGINIPDPQHCAQHWWGGTNGVESWRFWGEGQWMKNVVCWKVSNDKKVRIHIVCREISSEPMIMDLWIGKLGFLRLLQFHRVSKSQTGKSEQLCIQVGRLPLFVQLMGQYWPEMDLHCRQDGSLYNQWCGSGIQDPLPFWPLDPSPG